MTTMPRVMYHLALPDDWAAALVEGHYSMSTRGLTLDDVGFIHCGGADQLVGVANRYYDDLAELVVLHIDPTELTAEVRLEPGIPDDGELFPHLYGPLPVGAVKAVTMWTRHGDTWRNPPTG